MRKEGKEIPNYGERTLTLSTLDLGFCSKHDFSGDGRHESSWICLKNSRKRKQGVKSATVVRHQWRVELEFWPRCAGVQARSACMWSTTCVQLYLLRCFSDFASCGKCGVPLHWAFVFRCVLASLFWQGFGPFSRGLLFVCTERCSLEQCLRWVFSKYLLCLSLWLRSALFFSMRVVIQKMFPCVLYCKSCSFSTPEGFFWEQWCRIVVWCWRIRVVAI